MFLHAAQHLRRLRVFNTAPLSRLELCDATRHAHLHDAVQSQAEDGQLGAAHVLRHAVRAAQQSERARRTEEGKGRSRTLTAQLVHIS
jgi:hypothetical protein